MIHKVYLALGSNMGNKEQNLIEAIKNISLIDSTTVESVSNIYETDPVGYTEQDSFLNMVILVSTKLEPLPLLGELQKIEILLKRTREIHWGPRTIDIDILLYDNESITLSQLTIPHPRMFERAFVLVPLKDVYLRNDICGRDLEELISNCGDKDGVRLYKNDENNEVHRRLSELSKEAHRSYNDKEIMKEIDKELDKLYISLSD